MIYATGGGRGGRQARFFQCSGAGLEIYRSGKKLDHNIGFWDPGSHPLAPPDTFKLTHSLPPQTLYRNLFVSNKIEAKIPNQSGIFYV